MYLSYLIVSHDVKSINPVERNLSKQLKLLIHHSSKVSYKTKVYTQQIMQLNPLLVLVTTTPTSLALFRDNKIHQSKVIKTTSVIFERDLNSSSGASPFPSSFPTGTPTLTETMNGLTSTPSTTPSSTPSKSLSTKPTGIPSTHATTIPSRINPNIPTSYPTYLPPVKESYILSENPTNFESNQPSQNVTNEPSENLTFFSSLFSSGLPSESPSVMSSYNPTFKPSIAPSIAASSESSVFPSLEPSYFPSFLMSQLPSTHQSSFPSETPSKLPSVSPSILPSYLFTFSPSDVKSILPSDPPSLLLSELPSLLPSESPSLKPSALPSYRPSVIPSHKPSIILSVEPSLFPTNKPSLKPSKFPSLLPTNAPSTYPSVEPSFDPSQKPTTLPSVNPSMKPSSEPSKMPTQHPSIIPSKPYYYSAVTLCIRLAKTGYLSYSLSEVFEDITSKFLESVLASNDISSVKVEVISQVVAFDSGKTGLDSCPLLFKENDRTNGSRIVQEVYSTDLVVVLAIEATIWQHNSSQLSNRFLEEAIIMGFSDIEEYKDQLANADNSFLHLKSINTNVVKDTTDNTDSNDSSEPNMIAIVSGALLGFAVVTIVVAFSYLRLRFLNHPRGNGESEETDSRVDMHDIESNDENSAFSAPSFSVMSGKSFFSTGNSMDQFVTIKLDQHYSNNNSEHDSEEEVLRRESSFGSVNSMVTRFTWPGLPTINVRSYKD